MKNCILCLDYGIHDSHHIIPRERGGEDGPEIVICVKCHHSIHRSVKNAQVRDSYLSTLSTDSKTIARNLIATIEQAEVQGLKGTYVNLNVKLPRSLHEALKTAAKDRKTSIQQLVTIIISHALGQQVV